MPRSSNRGHGRSSQLLQRAPSRSDEVRSSAYHAAPAVLGWGPDPLAAPSALNALNHLNTFPHIGLDAGVRGLKRTHGGASSEMERDSSRAGAPLGVGGGRTPLLLSALGRPLTPEVAAVVTWTPNSPRKARAGDVAPSATGSHGMRLLGGGRRMRLLRCSVGWLSRSEARKIARHMASGALSSGARVMKRAMGDHSIVTPKAPADRTRAVLAWTKRVIGRSVGILQVKRGLAMLGCKKGKRKGKGRRKRAV